MMKVGDYLCTSVICLLIGILCFIYSDANTYNGIIVNNYYNWKPNTNKLDIHIYCTILYENITLNVLAEAMNEPSKFTITDEYLTDKTNAYCPINSTTFFYKYKINKNYIMNYNSDMRNSGITFLVIGFAFVIYTMMFIIYSSHHSQKNTTINNKHIVPKKEFEMVINKYDMIINV